VDRQHPGSTKISLRQDEKGTTCNRREEKKGQLKQECQKIPTKRHGKKKRLESADFRNVAPNRYEGANRKNNREFPREDRPPY